MEDMKLTLAKDVPVEESRFPYVKIDIKVDKEAAYKLYKKEYDKNFEGIKDACLSFNQWLNTKEIETIHEYLNYM